MYLTNTLQLKNLEKNKSKNWLKFLRLSGIFGKFHSVFQYFG